MLRAGLLVLLLLISVSGNLFFLTHLGDWQDSSSVNRNIPGLQKTFPLLAQRLLVEKPNDFLINFYPLRKQLREIAAEYGDTLAFYFEYLSTGTSIGVNEKENFVGASLIKLPVVMALYHQQERQGVDLSQKKTIIQKEDLDSGFGDLWEKGEGTEISLGEAARLALIESDNTAANVLARNVSQEDFEQVYEGLDIDVVSEENKTFISPKSYASILKALYFSAVLTKEHSQEILTLLSKVNSEDKLRSSLPKDVVVANKFGIYQNSAFQDCGIVYLPKRNYLLCVMSKSGEIEATSRISKISKAVYEYVSKINREKD